MLYEGVTGRKDYRAVRSGLLILDSFLDEETAYLGIDSASVFMIVFHCMNVAGC